MRNKKKKFKKGTIRVVNRWHKKKHPDVIRKKIDRKSPVGNPFKIEGDRTREDVIEAFEAFVNIFWIAHSKFGYELIYISNNYPSVKAWLLEVVDLYLEGKDIELQCSCKPKACHGDILKDLIIELANRKAKGFLIDRTDEDAIVDSALFFGSIEERFIEEAKEKRLKEENVEKLEQLYLLGDEDSDK